MTQNPSANLIVLAEIAHAAGRKIMEIYHSDFSTKTKQDASPVTLADTEAEVIIIAGLNKHFPEIPIIAEEQMASGIKTNAGTKFFLVDPLDGTKEFISKNGEFTVNIGLIENGVPTQGVVYAPALGEIFIGQSGNGAWASKLTPEDSFNTIKFTSIKTRACPLRGAIILASRSHCDEQTQAFIDAQEGAQISNAGSSLKFCRVAEGKADLYPRFGRTMEWDTAAGHAVLTAAGGTITKPDGSPFIYGKPDFANGAFIAKG